jgi:hypothetical protein
MRRVLVCPAFHLCFSRTRAGSPAVAQGEVHSAGLVPVPPLEAAGVQYDDLAVVAYSGQRGERGPGEAGQLLVTGPVVRSASGGGDLFGGLSKKGQQDTPADERA